MSIYFISFVEYSLFTFFTYFTTFPQNLYIHADKNSNIGLTRIGLGLINSQRFFWISNVNILFIVYIGNSFENKIIFSLAYSSLQIILFYKTIHLYKLLKESLN